MATPKSGLLKQQLSHEQVINWSGFDISSQGVLPPLRKGYYYNVVGQVIAGDAPKGFIRAYTYGEADRSNPRKWPAYIAKVGHKWYPNESITEHLLTRIGQLLDLKMAESFLVSAHGQIRFLSRYFLGRNQNLVHGAEIFSDYLKGDEFVEEVEQVGAAQDFFSFEFIEEAIREQFPGQASSILEGYTQMLAFDAIVGNNDRHHYNWGVVVHGHRKHEPYFSPIYDSARAFFWNDSESKLEVIKKDPNPKRLPAFIARYVKNSRPKTGWDGVNRPNHFALIQNIYQNYPDLHLVMSALCHPQLLQRIQETLNSEFGPLMSTLRREMILHCLKHRLHLFQKAVGVDS
ncbi:MAG: hypothetical protein F4Z86_06650 [Gemmatimonadetes bacterium]|nr:hypothetical protein [Gemmatimonadota bacterium]MYB54970.1 hypothetical protein [Gemmatimonadota bacterium]